MDLRLLVNEEENNAIKRARGSDEKDKIDDENYFTPIAIGSKNNDEKDGGWTKKLKGDDAKPVIVKEDSTDKEIKVDETTSSGSEVSQEIKTTTTKKPKSKSKSQSSTTAAPRRRVLPKKPGWSTSTSTQAEIEFIDATIKVIKEKWAKNESNNNNKTNGESIDINNNNNTSTSSPIIPLNE